MYFNSATKKSKNPSKIKETSEILPQQFKYMCMKNLILLLFSFLIISACNDEHEIASNLPPVMENQAFLISEGLTGTTTIGAVLASDPEQAALSFSITDDPSSLFTNTTAGVLSITNAEGINADKQEQYTLTVAVTDGKLTTSATIIIQVVMVDPFIVAQSFTAKEGLPGGTAVGQVVGEANDPLTFSITQNDNGLFEITTDGIIKLTTGKNLDFDVASSHTIVVQATDGKLSFSAAITIQVVQVESFISAQSFTVIEDIPEGTVIGQVLGKAENPLTYSIIQNDNDLFEITSAGTLSLATGKSLDFDAAASHTIIVQATDGELRFSATITIEVNAVSYSDPDAFVTIWETTAPDESITIPINSYYDYNYTVDWGNGEVSTNITTAATYTFSEPGFHTISITGNFPAIYFYNSEEKLKILSIEHWGAIHWKSFFYAFAGCKNMTYRANDIPDLDEVISLEDMFSNTSFNADITNWDVRNIVNMRHMFAFNFNFNQNLGPWDISAVKHMEGMLTFCNLSTSNYDATLKGWAALSTTPTNVELGASGQKYCDEGEAAREALISNKGWTITGDFKSSYCE